MSRFLNDITFGGNTIRFRMKNLFDKWVKQLEIHETKLSKDIIKAVLAKEESTAWLPNRK